MTKTIITGIRPHLPDAPLVTPAAGPDGGRRGAPHQITPALRAKRFRDLAVVVLLVTLAVIWVGIGYQLQHEHAEAIERVELETGTLAAALEKYSERSLRDVDAALVLTRELWLHQRQAVGVAMQHWLKSRQAGALALQYLIVDAEGKVILSTGATSKGDPSVAQQDFFRTHRLAADLAEAGDRTTAKRDNLYIGSPLSGPSSSQWLMFLSRPIYDPAQKFLGVVAVVADPAHFLVGIDSLDVGPHGVATLALRNGDLIARSVGRGGQGRETRIGGSGAGFSQLAARVGIVRESSPLDNVRRILSFRQHPEYPIWVGVGRAEADALVPFYRMSIYYGALAFVVSLALCGLILVLIRERARRIDVEARGLEETSRYRCLFDNLPEGIVIFDSSQGQVRAFNEAACSLLGRSAERMAALDLADFQLGNPPRVGLQDVRLSGPDGELVDVELSVARFSSDGKEAIQCVLRDVSQLRRSEAELRASRHLHQTLLSSIHEGVLLHLENATIAACNPAAERILGLSAAELIGRHSVDLRWRAIREDGSLFLGAQQPAIVAFTTGKAQRDVMMGLQKPGGEVTWISIDAVPLRLEPSPSTYGVLVTFTDVTPHRAAEEARLDEAGVFAAARRAVGH